MTELKNIDTQLTSVACSTTPSFVHLTAIAEGTNASQRVGRQVRLTNVSFIGGTAFSASSAALFNQFRVTCFYDLQSRGASPVVTDVLAFSTPTSFLNLSNKERFVILFDKMVHCGRTATNEFNFTDFTFDVDVDLPVQFGSSGTFPLTGAVSIMCLSLQAGAGYVLNGTARLMYSD